LKAPLLNKTTILLRDLPHFKLDSIVFLTKYYDGQHEKGLHAQAFRK